MSTCRRPRGGDDRDRSSGRRWRWWRRDGGGRSYDQGQTLGYPQAALFGFCLALVAFNLYAVVMAALRAAHPEQATDHTVSEYYLAGEIATTMNGLNIAVPEQDWGIFAQTRTAQFCEYLLSLAQRANLHHYRKATRGPKKPPPPRTKFKGQPHVSTAKLLAASQAAKKMTP